MKEFIRQDLYDNLLKSLTGNANFIQVVVGPRQVGKTTLVLQILKRWEGPKLYETADIPGTPPLLWLEKIWNQARDIPQTKEDTLLVVDEVQKIPHWSEMVKKLVDEDKRTKRKIRVVLLGSSSLLVQKGLQESLAGRFELHRHYQWSYPECQKAFGLTLPEYFFFGGYPGGLIIRNDFARWSGYIRDSLIESVLAKDILLTSPVSKPALLRQTFSLAVGHPAQIISYQKMLGSLIDAGNVTTIASYLRLLASSFLIIPLERYSGSVMRQRGSQPKIVVLDNSLISSTNNMSKEEFLLDSSWRGRVTENAVGAKLWVETEKIGGKLFYWRERDKEVDYVVKIGKDIFAVEVKSGVVKEKPTSGLEFFLKKYPRANGIVIGKQISLLDFFNTPLTNIIKTK
ncbi:MAG: ATP-binding protein [Patescibacteria group bacterium]|nr:ATP-binding protein [Patescibacteria group bacterium]